MSSANVRRTLTVPKQVDEDLQYLAESAGMSIEDLYVEWAQVLGKMPIKTLQKINPDLYRRLSLGNSNG